MTPEQIQVLEAVTADVLSREPHPELFADTVAACYIELTRLRDDLKTNIEAFNALSDENGTLHAEVARLTAIINDYGAYMHKEAEQLSKHPKEREWCVDCTLPTEVERLQIIEAPYARTAVWAAMEWVAERKRIAEAVIQATYDPVLADRIVAGEFEKEKRNEP